MADYNIAYNKLKEDEGGFSLRSTDPGGYTYMGLTRKDNPGFKGWNRVAYWVNKYGGPDAAYEKIFPDDELSKMVKDYIYKNYWVKFGCDRILDQHIAAHVYDFCFNSGKAAREINKAFGLGEKNEITDTTIQKLNSGFPFVVNDTIYKARIKYLLSLKMKFNGHWVPTVSKNRGLIIRANSFKIYKDLNPKPAAKTFDIFKTFWGN